MTNQRYRETILQMIIRMRIDLVEKLIQNKETDIKLGTERLEDPKYNYIFIQVGKAQDIGYKQGLEHELETLKEIQKQVKK